MQDIQPFLPEKVRGFLRPVSAENDETVQTKLIIVLLHRLHLVDPLLARLADRLERLA